MISQSSKRQRIAPIYESLSASRLLYQCAKDIISQELESEPSTDSKQLQINNKGNSRDRPKEQIHTYQKDSRCLYEKVKASLKQFINKKEEKREFVSLLNSENFSRRADISQNQYDSHYGSNDHFMDVEEDGQFDANHNAIVSYGKMPTLKGCIKQNWQTEGRLKIEEVKPHTQNKYYTNLANKQLNLDLHSQCTSRKQAKHTKDKNIAKQKGQREHSRKCDLEKNKKNKHQKHAQNNERLSFNSEMNIEDCLNYTANARYRYKFSKVNQQIKNLIWRKRNILRQQIYIFQQSSIHQNSYKLQI